MWDSLRTFKHNGELTMYLVSCLYEGWAREKHFIYEVASGYEAIKEFVRDEQNSQTVRRLRVTRLP